MSDYLIEFAYRALTRDYYPVIQQHRDELKWVGINWVEGDNEGITGNLLPVILNYADRYKQTPKSIDALLTYVITNPDNEPSFERTEGLADDLDNVKTYATDDEIKHLELDDAALVSALVNTARERWLGDYPGTEVRRILEYHFQYSSNPYWREQGNVTSVTRLTKLIGTMAAQVPDGWTPPAAKPVQTRMVGDASCVRCRGRGRIGKQDDRGIRYSVECDCPKRSQVAKNGVWVDA